MLLMLLLFQAYTSVFASNLHYDSGMRYKSLFYGGSNAGVVTVAVDSDASPSTPNADVSTPTPVYAPTRILDSNLPCITEEAQDNHDSGDDSERRPVLA